RDRPLHDRDPLQSGWSDGSVGRLHQRRSSAVEAPELSLKLRPRFALGSLILLAVEVAKPFAVRRPFATRPLVPLAKLFEVRGGSSHVTSFPRIGDADPTPGFGHRD